jgi:ubiquinone/menaquinone biosynthesis C-methylase UbiE
MSNDTSDIQRWWADHPMTYAQTHGETDYADGQQQLGTLEFFNRLDGEFYRWNTPLHNERPFGRLFPYDKYKDGRVLEIGCGLGTMAMNWAKAGARITAVDLNPTSIEMTQRRFSLHDLEGDIRLTDARALPFPNSFFDYAYSWGVLHHSPHLDRSIAELMRVLKPGGGVGIMLYNRRSILYWYSIAYLEGFLHYENRFLGALELASRYGDGANEEGNPHTWPITVDEAHALFSPYSQDMQVRCLGTDLDELFPRILPFLGRVVPTAVRKSWARRYGWSLWIEGKKK